MPELYLVGHGSWDGRMFRVPSGTRVHFYQQIGEELDQVAMGQILGGPATRPPPVRSFGPGESCPNAVLHPIMTGRGNAELRQWIASRSQQVDTLAVAQQTMLEDILTRYRGAEIHWVACTSAS